MVWAIPVFRWAFYTGMRSTEIGRLRWKHIDKERGLIKITRQKNRKEQTIPLISKAEEVLRHTPTPRGPEMYVFRTPDGPLRDRNEETFGRSASRHFCEARRRSDIDRELTFHDLRAGFATALADAGKSAHTIRAAMRHSSLKMALRYVSVSNVRLRSEMSDAL
jgi:integrase